MTEQQKSDLVKLRSKGYGYKKISRLLDIPENTVSAYCRRNHLYFNECKNCQKPIKKTKGTKPKKFCCDACRAAWWNNHLNEVNRKAYYELFCKNCGKPFISYGNINRKYCSRACYISDRFDKGDTK